MLLELLKMDNPKVRHGVSSVMSMISSNKKGSQYLTDNISEKLVPDTIRVNLLFVN